VAALDDWSEITREKKLQGRLVALITLVDPNPDSFRSRWRKSWDQRNRKELARLSAAPGVETLPRSALVGMGFILGSSLVPVAKPQPLSPSDLARMGRSLTQAGAPTEAVNLLRRAWVRYPGDFWINFELAVALHKTKNPPLGEVIRFYTAALAVRPDSAIVLNNLGIALAGQQDRKGAIAAFHKAIGINPKDARAHYNLGIVLADLDDVNGAIAAYRRAIALNPKYVVAHGNLGFTLMKRGAYREALVPLEEAVRGLPRADRRRLPLLQAIQLCRPLAMLEKKLNAVLKGDEQPESNAERLNLAQLCLVKRLHAAASRFYQQVFAADPKLADDLKSTNRYKAAIAAALAARGQGEDGANLDNKERAHWRKQAVVWLQADLALWSRVLGENSPQARATVRHSLQQWQKNPALVGIRDDVALARLPQEEQTACRKLWSDASELLKKAGR
jgi:Flp pilus assembly protein TadD